MNSSGIERHDLVSRLPVAAIVLAAEGDTALVERRSGGELEIATRWV